LATQHDFPSVRSGKVVLMRKIISVEIHRGNISYFFSEGTVIFIFNDYAVMLGIDHRMIVIISSVVYDMQCIHCHFRGDNNINLSVFRDDV
jgi:hypothetical protein